MYYIYNSQAKIINVHPLEVELSYMYEVYDVRSAAEAYMVRTGKYVCQRQRIGATLGFDE